MGQIIESFNENGICAVCRKKPVERWCDYIINYDNYTIFVKDHKLFQKLNDGPRYETCDLPMCKDCVSKVSKDVDFCQHHMSLHKKIKLPNDYQRIRQGQEKGKIYSGQLDRRNE